MASYSGYVKKEVRILPGFIISATPNGPEQVLVPSWISMPENTLRLLELAVKQGTTITVDGTVSNSGFGGWPGLPAYTSVTLISIDIAEDAYPIKWVQGMVTAIGLDAVADGGFYCAWIKVLRDGSLDSSGTLYRIERSEAANRLVQLLLRGAETGTLVSLPVSPGSHNVSADFLDSVLSLYGGFQVDTTGVPAIVSVWPGS